MNGNRPAISVIIPAYNSAGFIGECLDSVVAQSGAPSYEVIVVDDASTDNTSEIIARYPTVRYIPQTENCGPAAARNIGIEASDGEYLLFVDSDDIISPDALGRLWECVKQHPGVDVVYGITDTFPTKGLKKRYLDIRSMHIPGYADGAKDVRQAWSRLPDMNCNRLLRREWLINNHLLFSTLPNHEDFDWHLRAYGKVGSYAVATGEPTYHYRLLESSVSSRLSHRANRRAIYSIIERTVPQIDCLDAPVMRLITEQILEYKFDGESSHDKEQYRRILTLLSQHSSARRWHRLIVKAVKLYPKGLPRCPFLYLIR